MTLDTIFYAALAALVVLGALAIVQFSRPIRYAQSVIVNTKTGHAVEGVLVSRRGGALTIAQATILIEGRDPEEVDGKIVVQRGNVDFVQTTTRVTE